LVHGSDELSAAVDDADKDPKATKAGSGAAEVGNDAQDALQSKFDGQYGERSRRYGLREHKKVTFANIHTTTGEDAVISFVLTKVLMKRGCQASSLRWIGRACR
jgi:hypothetical protein